MKKLALTISVILLAGVVGWNYIALPVSRDWSSAEIGLIQSLSLANLPSLAADPSNQYADNELAAEFGHTLFFDTRLSSNGAVSCSTCHQPEKMFTDGLPQAMGTSIGTHNTPSLVGIAHSPWFYWDGRKDSQWAQALAPIEAEHEQNFTRLQVLQLLADDAEYSARYSELFGELPALPSQIAANEADSKKLQLADLDESQQQQVSRVFSNVGKVLAAYQRKLLPAPARFDAYADSLSIESDSTPSSVLNGSEIAGLRLFLGKGQCVNCHNGPLFTNHEFHNTAILSAAGQLPSMGRYDGIRTARNDPFNCLGQFSDANTSECIEMRFARDSNDLVGAHKTPTLRNVTATAPYMHSGQLANLQDVLNHYNDAPVSMLSHNEAKPLGLRNVELRQLEAFLETLSAPLNIDPRWLTTPE